MVCDHRRGEIEEMEAGSVDGEWELNTQVLVEKAGEIHRIEE